MRDLHLLHVMLLLISIYPLTFTYYQYLPFLHTTNVVGPPRRLAHLFFFKHKLWCSVNSKTPTMLRRTSVWFYAGLVRPAFASLLLCTNHPVPFLLIQTSFTRWGTRCMWILLFCQFHFVIVFTKVTLLPLSWMNWPILCYFYFAFNSPIRPSKTAFIICVCFGVFYQPNPVTKSNLFHFWLNLFVLSSVLGITSNLLNSGGNSTVTCKPSLLGYKQWLPFIWIHFLSFYFSSSSVSTCYKLILCISMKATVNICRLYYTWILRSSGSFRAFLSEDTWKNLFRITGKSW